MEGISGFMKASVSRMTVNVASLLCCYSVGYAKVSHSLLLYSYCLEDKRYLRVHRGWIDLVLRSAMIFVESRMTVSGVLLFSSLIVSSSLNQYVVPFPL